MSDDIRLDPRRVGHRLPAKIMVIVVEGRSEKVYFERFRTREQPIAIRIHESKYRTAEGMVEKCLDLIRRSDLDTETDDVIAVFDADRSTTEEIENALKTASEHGIKLYISNPSFEFWLLLHFENNRVDCIQDDLEKLLEKHTGVKYKKSDGLNRHIDNKAIVSAITRSRSILPSGNPIECKKKTPSTCLHLLIEKLIKK